MNTKPRTSHHPLSGGEALKGQEGHCQSDEQWNCFKDNTGKTSERQDGAHMGFSKHINTIFN